MRATPCLMFTGQAQEAMETYLRLFPDGRILSVDTYGPEGPGVEGTIKQAQFQVAGLVLRCLDSPPVHAFGFTPSWSVFVELDGPDQVDPLAEALLEGGQALMPAGDYGFSRRFAWVQDRFGVSWQLNAAF